MVYLQRKMRVDPKRDITLIVPQVPWCYTRDGPPGPHGPMGLWAEVLKNGGDRDRALRELGRQGSLTVSSPLGGAGCDDEAGECRPKGDHHMTDMHLPVHLSHLSLSLSRKASVRGDGADCVPLPCNWEG